MKWSSRIRQLGLAVMALLLVAACGSSSGGGTAACTSAKTATSASDCGGIDGLVAAAKAEGRLNVIALPPDWANYGAIISGFTAKYGIPITSDNPNGSSQDEVNAVQQLGASNRAPDVLDIGMAVALANTNLFAPYKVATWNDILASQKEPTGLWFQDYGGYMSIGYDSSKVPTISSMQDLLGSSFRGKVALNGDPTKANAALNGVMMASLANGGSLSDISKGVDFFHQLKVAGNFVPVQATTATVKNGTTPVVFDWTTCRLPTAPTSRAGRCSSPPTRSWVVTTPRRSARRRPTPQRRGCGRSTSTPTRARTCGSRVSLGRFAWRPCRRLARSTRPPPLRCRP